MNNKTIVLTVRYRNQRIPCHEYLHVNAKLDVLGIFDFY